MKELTQKEMLETIGGHVRYEHLHNTERNPHQEHAGAHYHEPSHSNHEEHTSD